MLWSTIREVYPDQWLVVEALAAHGEGDDRRVLDDLAVIETAPDGSAAMSRYRQLRCQYPIREFYFLHTARETVDIIERHWLGMRGDNALHAA